MSDRVGVPENLPGIVPPEVAHHNLKTHDEYGLSLDPKNWASPKCEDCGGQGIVIITRVTKASDLVPGATGSGNKTTQADACHAKRCAMVNYWKVRGPLQERIVRVWQDDKLTEEKKLDAIKSMIEVVHTQVKAAGTITDLKAVVEASKKAIESVILKPNSVSMPSHRYTPRRRK